MLVHVDGDRGQCSIPLSLHMVISISNGSIIVMDGIESNIRIRIRIGLFDLGTDTHMSAPCLC